MCDNRLFLFFRLRDISEESTVPTVQPRRRSNSLPIPQIEISLYQGSGSKDSPSNSSSKDFMEVPEPPISTIINDPSPFQPLKSLDKPDESTSTNSARRTSTGKKRVKMADLRTLIETKILSKSDRGLEKIGAENGSNGQRLLHTVIQVKKVFSLFYKFPFDLVMFSKLFYEIKFEF